MLLSHVQSLGNVTLDTGTTLLGPFSKSSSGSNALSMLWARRTFVGIVELRPTKLLEDGLRAHLAQRAAHAAAALLAFSNHPTPLAYPPLAPASQSSLANLFSSSASLTAEIPGRCTTLSCHRSGLLKDRCACNVL